MGVISQRIQGDKIKLNRVIVAAGAGFIGALAGDRISQHIAYKASLRSANRATRLAWRDVILSGGLNAGARAGIAGGIQMGRNLLKGCPLGTDLAP